MFNVSEKTKNQIFLGISGLANPTMALTAHEIMKQRAVISVIPESEYQTPFTKEKDLQIMDGMTTIPFILSALSAYCVGWSLGNLNKNKTPKIKS
jgi:hypothetical protein